MERRLGDWKRLGTIMRRLKAENGRYVPGPLLLAESGLTRAAAWKYIERLREWGYGIIASPRRGYCLTRSPDIPFPWEVEPYLTTRRLGHALLYYDTLSSTNREAGRLAEAGAPEGLVVVTDYQTEGRGRLERSWHSPPGRNLLFSLLLRPEGPLDKATSLPLLLALALRQTLRTLTPALNPMVKWPNDLLVDGRKIAGILCEMQAEPDRIRYLIAGLGLNVNMTSREFPPDLRITASSLRLLTKRAFSRPSLLAAFLNTFETFYDQWRHDGFTPFLDEYRRCDALAGRPVRIQQSDRILEGWADGLEPDGALRIRRADATTVHVHSGDAHVLPQSSKQRIMPCDSLPSPSLSPLERAIPGLFVRDVSGQPDRSQYGHLLFVANQRNRAYQDYLISRLERLKECGVSGVYRDSHFTMCCDTFHHAHDDRGSWVYTMHEDELAIQRRVQEDLGLLYYVDGGGIFGTPLVGTAYDLIHGLEPFYQDVETADLDLRQVQANGRDPFEAYFRGMSCRLFYQVNVEVNRFPASGSLSAWWQPDRFAALLEGYARVEPHMGSMHLLEEDGGTEWRDPLGHRVIFPWKRLPVSCLCPDGRRVTDVVACARLSAEEAMEPGHIYFVENPSGKRR